MSHGGTDDSMSDDVFEDDTLRAPAQRSTPSPTGYRDYRPADTPLRTALDDDMPIHKTILLGDSGVGKTSLLVQFETGKFQPGNFSATVGIGFTKWQHLTNTRREKGEKKKEMPAATAAVREKRMGYLKAAKHFNVPRSTLFRFVQERDSPIESIMNKVIGVKPVFDKSLSNLIENLLVEYVLTMENKFYGLTRMDLRRLASQLALNNNIQNRFKDGFAGRYLLKGFLKRHEEILSIRQPTGTSQARVNGFTKEIMDEFYDNLEKVHVDKSFPATLLFNVDVSGVSIVQSKIPKIIARKGKKQTGAMASAERRSIITIVICMSPAGVFVPPMIIFLPKNMSNALMRGALVGSIGKVHQS